MFCIILSFFSHISHVCYINAQVAQQYAIKMPCASRTNVFVKQGLQELGSNVYQARFVQMISIVSKRIQGVKR